LFLFVVMMLDIQMDKLRDGFWKAAPLAGLIGAIFALEMAAVLLGGFRGTESVQMAGQSAPDYSNTKELGKLLYTQYLLPLEVAAVLLLVAIIAAIALTLRERKDSRHIDPALQVRVKARDRVQVLKMEPTVAAPPPSPADDTTKEAKS